ncbi:MAG: hypothetical protein WDM96_07665 [Lacunisphaera sp.]
MHRALSEHRPVVRAQWEKLLRLDRGSSALARPDALVYLLDTTLDELYAILPAWSQRRHPSHMAGPACPCGRSPFLAYFATGRQALHEGLVTVQARMPALTAQARDDALACLDQAFLHLARREIEAFCSVCQFHPGPARRGERDAPLTAGS